MKRAAFGWATLIVIACGSVRPVPADDIAVTDNDRVYRTFTREAATVGAGVMRLELRGMGLEDEGGTRLDLIGLPVDQIAQHPSDQAGKTVEVHRVNGGIVDLLGSYGLGRNAEVGIDIPFVIEKITLVTPQVDPSTGAVTRTSYRRNNDQGIGDVQLYGKFKRPVATNCSVAAGMELSLPTGADDLTEVDPRRFGSGETGVTPFVSTRYQAGRVAFGVNTGYQISSGSVDDVFHYGTELIWRLLPTTTFRAEIAGRVFKTSNLQYDDLVLLPGADVALTDSVAVRPTGMVGLTREATDWGIGIGFVFQR